MVVPQANVRSTKSFVGKIAGATRLVAARKTSATADDAAMVAVGHQLPPRAKCRYSLPHRAPGTMPVAACTEIGRAHV